MLTALRSPGGQNQPHGHQWVTERMNEMWSGHTVASSDTRYNVKQPRKHNTT